jgi:hypothetical protein
VTRFNAVRNMYFESVYNFYSGFGTILEEPSSGPAIVKKNRKAEFKSTLGGSNQDGQQIGYAIEIFLKESNCSYIMIKFSNYLITHVFRNTYYWSDDTVA